MIVCAQMSHLASNSLDGTRSAAVSSKSGQSSAAVANPSTFRTGDVNQPPNLNILNQANSISQLSANNTSFDPTQLVGSSEQADGVITAFSGLMVQNSTGDNGSAAAAVVSTTSTMNGTNNLRVSPSLQQQQHHVPLQIQQQQLVQTTNQNTSVPPTVSPAPPNAAAVMVPTVVTHHHPSQMPYQNATHHHVQPLQPKPMQNGRVPATKHDNRKLFVGGLPNEVTDYTFLQFFQQYGEVVDSIVLLDRRTKRSRGFGFVTFADESVANRLLNVIPGRTGTINIFGKNCEIKASEPKTEESYHQPHLHSHHLHSQQLQSSQWGDNNYTPHQLVFGANGAAIHPITNQSGVQVGPSPPPLQTPPTQNVNYPVGAVEQGVGMPLYSHSTITRTTAGPILSVDGAPQEGMANVYIQNNFYTLPPGTQLSPSHPLNASPTMETLQMREEEFANGGGTVTYTHQQSTLNPAASSHAPFAYPGEALQPAYPGPEVENSAGNSI